MQPPVAAIPDSRVPDILLAYANGISAFLHVHLPECSIERMNNHDLSTPGGFAPVLCLHYGNGKSALMITIGMDHIEYWDFDCVKNDDTSTADLEIVPMCCLEYSHPDLMRLILDNIVEYFRKERDESVLQRDIPSP
jgi:hypothetical protein